MDLVRFRMVLLNPEPIDYLMRVQVGMGCHVWLYLAAMIACRLAAVQLLNLFCICQRQSPGETGSGVRVLELRFRLYLEITCMNQGFLNCVKGVESSL